MTCIPAICQFLNSLCESSVSFLAKFVTNEIDNSSIIHQLKTTCVFLAIAHKCSGIAQDVDNDATETLGEIPEAKEFLKNRIECCKELLK